MSFPGGAFQGYLGGPSCTEASRWYSEVGFTPSTDHAHMPDHVAAQLEFVGNLYLAEARALGNGHQEQAAALCKIREGFEKAFLDRWLESFAKRLATNGISELYRSIGRLLLRP
jgi:TorA maturation chaperone TorD